MLLTVLVLVGVKVTERMSTTGEGSTYYVWFTRPVRNNQLRQSALDLGENKSSVEPERYFSYWRSPNKHFV